MPNPSLQSPPAKIIKQLINLYNNRELNVLVERGKKLLILYPKAFFIWNILGAALMDLGSTKEAEKAFERVTYLNPNYAAGFNNLGVIQKKQGKLEDAANAFKKAIKLKPDYAEAYNNLGVTIEQSGNHKEALNLYKKSITLKPNYEEAYNNLGNVLKNQSKLNEAINAYNKAISINPKYPEAFNNLGIVFQSQGRLEEALSSYNNAIFLNPKYSSAYNNLGVILEAQGNFSEATEAYKKALSLRPDYAEAHRNLSNFTHYQPKNSQIGVVSELLKNKDLNEKDKCNLHYTMAKMKEDLGDYSKAYEHYTAGGALRKKELLYNPKNDDVLFSKIKETFHKLENHSIKKINKRLKHTPVFILGMPRSGTTLVEQIISSHSKVQGAGELNLLSQLGHSLAVGHEKITTNNLLRLRNSYLSELEKISRKMPFVTDKMPINFLYIGLILSSMPEAKIIHVKRDPKATCWSNFKHYFSGEGLKYSYDLNDTIHFFNLYIDLLQYWSKKYGGRIYHLNYEKLTLKQELETKKLIDYVGLDWEKACLSPHKNKRNVQTASAKQVRNTIYTGSSNAWQSYTLYLNNVFNKISD